MADTKDILLALKSMGAKSVTFGSTSGALWLDVKDDAGVIAGAAIQSIEFFPSISPLDLDTLVPPPDPEEDPSRAEPVPRAIANILKRGSVS